MTTFLRLSMLLAIFLTANTLTAQWIMINKGGGNPDSTAALQVQSNDRGLLIPRMTQAERNAIEGAAQGLLVYQTDQDTGFYFFRGNTWVNVAQSLDNDADNTNELQTLSVNGNDLSISNGNTVSLSSASSGVFVPDETQPIPIAFAGDTLFVHPTLNSSSIQFSSSSTTFSFNSLTNGESNTNSLSSLPANLCRNLTAFGYSDWYLPSLAETLAIARNAHLFPNIIGFNALGGAALATINIWSSSVASSNVFSVSYPNIEASRNVGQQGFAACWCVRR